MSTSSDNFYSVPRRLTLRVRLVSSDLLAGRQCTNYDRVLCFYRQSALTPELCGHKNKALTVITTQERPNSLLPLTARANLFYGRGSLQKGNSWRDDGRPLGLLPVEEVPIHAERVRICGHSANHFTTFYQWVP